MTPTVPPFPDRSPALPSKAFTALHDDMRAAFAAINQRLDKMPTRSQLAALLVQCALDPPPDLPRKEAS